MARPKEFDQDKAMHEAIRLFSKQGFAATSTDELMRAMDIGRQSMYGAFGDKRSLFLKALETYVTESVDSVIASLEKPGPALTIVRNALTSFAARKDMTSTDGCMGMNAICEFGQRDEEVNAIRQEAARRQRQAVRGLLERAKHQGELDSDANVDSLADFFESMVAGMRMAVKAGKSRESLRNIATLAARVYAKTEARRG